MQTSGVSNFTQLVQQAVQQGRLARNSGALLLGLEQKGLLSRREISEQIGPTLVRTLGVQEAIDNFIDQKPPLQGMSMLALRERARGGGFDGAEERLTLLGQIIELFDSLKGADNLFGVDHASKLLDHPDADVQEIAALVMQKPTVVALADWCGPGSGTFDDDMIETRAEYTRALELVKDRDNITAAVDLLLKEYTTLRESSGSNTVTPDVLKRRIGELAAGRPDQQAIAQTLSRQFPQLEQTGPTDMLTILANACGSVGPQGQVITREGLERMRIAVSGGDFLPSAFAPSTRVELVQQVIAKWDALIQAAGNPRFLTPEALKTIMGSSAPTELKQIASTLYLNQDVMELADWIDGEFGTGPLNDRETDKPQYEAAQAILEDSGVFLLAINYVANMVSKGGISPKSVRDTATLMGEDRVVQNKIIASALERGWPYNGDIDFPAIMEHASGTTNGGQALITGGGLGKLKDILEAPLVSVDPR
jgi:hypothetical protein